MRQLNVAVLFDSHTPTDGGSFSLISSILEGFISARNETKHNIILISVGKQKNSSADLLFKPTSKFIRFIGNLLFSRNGRFANIWQSKSKLARFLCRHQIDIVYFLGVPVEITNVPFIMNVWDLQHRTHPWFPELSKEKYWQDTHDYYRKHLPRALGVITGTRQGRDEITQFYGVDKRNIYLIPHVISELPELDTSDARMLRTGSYLYPANFWAHKNHNLIIQAVKILKDSRNLTVNVTFIGDDKGNLSYIKNCIEENGLANQIKCLGFVSNDVKAKMYSLSKGLIYASFSGPENLPPLEAFSAGIPVIYSEFPGAKEQLGDLPFYFDPLNPLSLAQAIELVENQSESERFNLVREQKNFVETKQPSDFATMFFDVISNIEFAIRAGNSRIFYKFKAFISLR
jgi:glycosyltransferase involved in cell wall biosynthesis